MINWKVHTYATLPSTQDYVKELVEEGLPEGIVVQALMQTKGHGRHGRKWESPMGNLYMSVLLRPNCAVEEAGQISFVASLAVSDTIDKYIAKGHDKSLKWPNDVLIDGKKVSGIIMEKEADGYALGFGVNIMSAPEDAIALQDVWTGQVAVHPFRDTLLEEFGKLYALWQKNGFELIRKRWLEQAHGVNKSITVNLANKKIDGTFRTIDGHGTLMLEEESGKEIAITSGDVYFSD